MHAEFNPLKALAKVLPKESASGREHPGDEQDAQGGEAGWANHVESEPAVQSCEPRSRQDHEHVALVAKEHSRVA